MTEENKTPKVDDSVSRRALAKKVAYVAPTVLALIAATAQPLAASGGVSPN